MWRREDYYKNRTPEEIERIKSLENAENIILEFKDTILELNENANIKQLWLFPLWCYVQWEKKKLRKFKNPRKSKKKLQ